MMILIRAYPQKFVKFLQIKQLGLAEILVFQISIFGTMHDI